MTLDELRVLIGALEDSRVEYALIGGAALNAHGIVRATEDVDIIVRPTPDNVARLRTALRSVWNDASIEDISADDLAGDYPVVRYGPPTGTVYIDIVARLGEAFRFDDVIVERVSIGSRDANVATPETLYRMKKDTVRAIDRADAEALRARFGLED